MIILIILKKVWWLQHNSPWGGLGGLGGCYALVIIIRTTPPYPPSRGELGHGKVLTTFQQIWRMPKNSNDLGMYFKKQFTDKGKTKNSIIAEYSESLAECNQWKKTFIENVFYRFVSLKTDILLIVFFEIKKTTLIFHIYLISLSKNNI